MFWEFGLKSWNIYEKWRASECALSLSGTLVILEKNGAWDAALSFVVVAHCPLGWCDKVGFSLRNGSG
jgi:hypothetical protein